MKKGSYKSAQNNGLRILHRKTKNTKKNKIDKDEQILGLIKCLQEGNTAPVFNYLKSKLSRTKKLVYIPTCKAEELRLELIKNSTPSEKLAKVKLKDLGVKTLFQEIVYYNKNRNFYIVDFLISSIKTVVEIDGGYHNTKEQQLKDANRTKRLNLLGYNVVRFTNKEVYIQGFIEENVRKLL